MITDVFIVIYFINIYFKITSILQCLQKRQIPSEFHPLGYCNKHYEVEDLIFLASHVVDSNLLQGIEEQLREVGLRLIEAL